MRIKLLEFRIDNLHILRGCSVNHVCNKVIAFNFQADVGGVAVLPVGPVAPVFVLAHNNGIGGIVNVDQPEMADTAAVRVSFFAVP